MKRSIPHLVRVRRRECTWLRRVGGRGPENGTRGAMSGCMGTTTELDGPIVKIHLDGGGIYRELRADFEEKWERTSRVMFGDNSTTAQTVEKRALAAERSRE